MDDPKKPSDENEGGDWQERSHQREGSHPAIDPLKQLALLAALNSDSLEEVDDVKQGMQRFRELPEYRAVKSKKKTSEYTQESYAERGEEMRRHAGLHSAVVDHDAKTNAQGGLPPIPGAKTDPAALIAPKLRRTTTRKTRDR